MTAVSDLANVRHSLNPLEVRLDESQYTELLSIKTKTLLPVSNTYNSSRLHMSQVLETEIS